MSKPPLNTYIKWDGQKFDGRGIPVPSEALITAWSRLGRPDTGYCSSFDWRVVTAYLVHAYPKEDEVFECWLEMEPEGIFHVQESDIPMNWRVKTKAHIQCINGVFKITGQEKA